MIKRLLTLLSLTTCFVLAKGQDNYFQQFVQYDIRVSLDDENHILHGQEKFTYTNNSDGSLDYIMIHLWPNAYKNDETELAKQLLEEGNTRFYYSNETQRGFIEGIDFKVNGKSAAWAYEPDHIDICRIILDSPLGPGESIEISTPFIVHIPIGVFSRLGHIGQQYQITQWYPKPAVYDINGWHDMPYLNQGEFYSEFGTYDVYVTLPKNYVVAATGDLVNGESELEWLNEKAELTARTATFNKDSLGFPPSSSDTKTLHYHQEKVHDFAWFADKRYNVLKGEVILPHSQRKVTTWVMFTNLQANLWKNALEYVHDATYYYSLWNGDYPYNQVTAVDGALSAGGGMEYPNVTVIGGSVNAFGLETVIMHEVGHNWFYGILGTNERYNAWMDEGINSFNENRYIETKYPGYNALSGTKDAPKPFKFAGIEDFSHKKQYQVLYDFLASRKEDQPIQYPAADYTSANYGGVVYGKTSLVFDYLKAYLGEEVFDKAMQTYFEKWKFKHPGPKDLQKIFEEVTGKDLKWFFNDIINTTNYMDYRIGRLKKDTTGNYQLKIKNNGSLNVPFSVSAMSGDSVLFTKWYEPQKDHSFFVPFPNGDYNKVRIDATENMLDINRQNNTIRKKGLFRKWEPLKIRLLAGLENGYKSELYVSPLVGWNYYDKAMLGLSIYNSTLPEKHFEYVLSPMYGTATGRLTGFGKVGYTLYTKSVFHRITTRIKAQKFGYQEFAGVQSYTKIAPEVEVKFRKRDPRKPVNFILDFRNININEDTKIFDATEGLFKSDNNKYYINDLTFKLSNNETVNPYYFQLAIHQGQRFVKAGLDANLIFKYKQKNKAFRVRFFVGSFLYNDNADPRINFGINGGTDYSYDYLYLGRNTTTPNVLSQQFINTEGGMKHPLSFSPPGNVTVQNPNRWLNTIHLTSTLPKVPLSLYVEGGIGGYEYLDSDGNLISETSVPFWDMGVSLNIIPNNFVIYFPIAISQNPNQLRYIDKVRFTLYLTKFNIHELKRNFSI